MTALAKSAALARVTACDDFDIGDLLLTVLVAEGVASIAVRGPASDLWPVKAFCNALVGPGTAALRACADHLDGLDLREVAA